MPYDVQESTPPSWTRCGANAPEKFLVRLGHVVSEKTMILFQQNGLAFGAFRLLTDILVSHLKLCVGSKKR
jgi:hypothetical protein